MGVLCLLVTLGAGRVGAADLSGSKGAAQGPWSVALALFPKVGAATLAEISAPDFTLEEAKRIAGSTSYDALSATLPRLILQALSPLPNKWASPSQKQRPVAFADLSANGEAVSGAPFVDLARESMAIKGENPGKEMSGSSEENAWDGLVAGFFALTGDAIECRVVVFESGMGKARRTFSWDGNIDRLEQCAESLLPGMVSWIAGQELGVVDFLPLPEKGAPLALTLESGGERAVVKGCRLFIASEGDIRIRMERVGYETRSIEIAEARPGSYRRETVTLETMGTPSSAISLATAGPVLDWKEADAFKRSEKRYRSALGRFVASIPLTALGLGVFFSYSEAYARGAVSDASYYTSGACAVAVTGVSLGFLIDCAVGLVNFLRVSR